MIHPLATTNLMGSHRNGLVLFFSGSMPKTAQAGDNISHLLNSCVCATAIGTAKTQIGQVVNPSQNVIQKAVRGSKFMSDLNRTLHFPKYATLVSESYGLDTTELYGLTPSQLNEYLISESSDSKVLNMYSLPSYPKSDETLFYTSPKSCDYIHHYDGDKMIDGCMFRLHSELAPNSVSTYKGVDYSKLTTSVELPPSVVALGTAEGVSTSEYTTPVTSSFLRMSYVRHTPETFTGYDVNTDFPVRFTKPVTDVIAYQNGNHEQLITENITYAYFVSNNKNAEGINGPLVFVGSVGLSGSDATFIVDRTEVSTSEGIRVLQILPTASTYVSKDSLEHRPAMTDPKAYLMALDESQSLDAQFYSSGGTQVLLDTSKGLVGRHRSITASIVDRPDLSLKSALLIHSAAIVVESGVEPNYLVIQTGNECIALKIGVDVSLAEASHLELNSLVRITNLLVPQTAIPADSDDWLEFEEAVVLNHKAIVSPTVETF